MVFIEKHCYCFFTVIIVCLFWYFLQFQGNIEQALLFAAQASEHNSKCICQTDADICKKVNWKCNSNCLLSLTSHHFILYCNTNAKQMKICCKISKKAIKLDWECNSNVLCHEWWIQRSEWIKSFQNFCLDLISGRRNHEAISRKQYSQHHNFSKSQ